MAVVEVVEVVVVDGDDEDPVCDCVVVVVTRLSGWLLDC